MKIDESYVIGLLVGLERKVPELQERLRSANLRASTVDAELSSLLGRMDDAKATIDQATSQISKTGLVINDGNFQVSSLHQEIAVIRTRSEDIKTEMDRLGSGTIQRKLRRQRAKLTVQIEDREEEIETVRTQVEQERTLLHAAEQTLGQERDRLSELTLSLDQLQGQLPSPYLYAELAMALLARGHCVLFLEQNLISWQEDLELAIVHIMHLHSDLRLGKYRLDKNSDLVGGRHMSTVESVYAAVAMGDNTQAVALFKEATEKGLKFDQIFNLFRIWVLGLYLTGEHDELQALLHKHQYSEGLRGGYCQAFIGLLIKDKRRVTSGLHAICKHEWELWQDPALERGAGIVNLGAVAISRLALERGLSVQMPGATVPDVIITGPSIKSHR